MSRLYISGNAVDQNDIPVVGAKVYVRADGELAALEDAAGASAPNPITTIANGFFEAYSTATGPHTLDYEWAGRVRFREALSDTERAQAAAQAALAAAGAPPYANTADGLAAVDIGETFYVVSGGVGTIYRKDAGPVATQISKFIVDPAATTTAGLLGFAQTGTGASSRTVQTKLREILSVKDFGAVGDGTTNDAAAIQAAIDAAEVLATTQAGARVVFPAGNYRINSGLRVKKDRIEIEFAQGARLVPYGSFDTLRFESASATTFIYHNKLINGLFDETNKTGGKALVGKYIAEGSFTLTTAGGYDGIQLDTFNTVDLDARVTDLTSTSAIYCLVRGGGSVGARSDVLRIHKMVMGGSTYVDGQNGLVIDGFVHTVVGKSVYGVNVGGRVLVTQNTIGAADNPAFLNFWDFETDFQKNEAIYLAEGQIAEFQGAICNGSRATSNIFVGSSFKDARFIGGRSTGAAQAGVSIAGADVAVIGMKCMSNSSNQYTGTLNTYPGILVGGTSSGTRILGCRSGDASTSTYQTYGIQVDTGATNFIVKDNDVRNNVSSGVANGTGGTSASKIISDNIA